ncbi:MAG: ATP-binding cassette domain-containing protein [Bifidobacteriaceae bacterium]|jgi:ABC-2 type transport system ATP-binding protein|nr:ATP-binding cassette domain-containing protein [Bifidobacteriaceae bacterium]
MLSVENLSKKFGEKQALRGISFEAHDGRVTGFLGPNGAGKSTTMRALLGLIRADSGTALVDGHAYATSRSPLTHVGAVLDAKSAHKGRSARSHLLAMAHTHGISRQRVEEVLAYAGLKDVDKRRAGGFSLGMSQRLNIAAAILGDPHNLVLDEPVNGLDPEGVRWVRELCRYYASTGRAVLLSSHLMSEVALTADDLVIIGRGRILAQFTVQEFLERYSSHAVRVITPTPNAFTTAFATLPQAHVEQLNSHGDEASVASGTAEFRITGIPLAQAAELIANQGIVVYQLNEERTSLEDAYLQLTHGATEYASSAAVQPQQPGQSQRPVDTAMEGVRS